MLFNNIEMHHCSSRERGGEHFMNYWLKTGLNPINAKSLFKIISLLSNIIYFSGLNSCDK